MGDDKSEKNEVWWYEVYHELAKELAKLKTKDSQKKFYEACMNDKDFREQHNWTKVLEKKRHWINNTKEGRVRWGHYHDKVTENEEYLVKRFDPMQIFASFNGFGMKEESRIKKINIYFRLLGSEKHYSEEKKEIDFTGCPAPMILALILMRNPDQITILWEAFIDVMTSKKEAKVHFKNIKKCHGVSVESFTVLLFWIDSKNFLPLDKNTLALFETNNKKIKYETWEKYKENLVYENTDIYQIISKIAWSCEEKLINDELKDFGIKKCPSKSLKIIAIKPLDGCNEKFLKGLKKNAVYLFDKAYSIDKDGSIEYYKEKDIQLFNQDSSVQVNITAIVGKNGTGKSTLIELLLAVINNVTKSREDIQGLKVELIFEDLHIYKVEINKESIQLFEYQDEEKDIDEKWKKIEFSKKQLFYNILVNYSIHSLDSSKDSWIEPYFKYGSNKNIVIEPFRNKGNINIQKEEKEVKHRLIRFLLQEKDDNSKYDFRQLTKEYSAIELTTTTSKSKYTYIKQTENKRIYKIEDLSKELIERNEKSSDIEDDYFKDIILSNGITELKLSDLSSGEKQKIYSINSILYHIQRLDKEKKYKHINLILDEIELYFHPELQRTYIHDIIEAIKKVGTENILGINITFITHSPFILSDIPESKILFLDKESDDADAKTVPIKTDTKTFGANIHNLLNSSFFMKNGLMGEFAKNKIQNIIDFFNEKKTMKEISMEKEQMLKIIESIGEPFLKSKLLDMYNRKFILDYKDRKKIKIQEQISELNSKLKELDNDSAK